MKTAVITYCSVNMAAAYSRFAPTWAANADTVTVYTDGDLPAVDGVEVVALWKPAESWVENVRRKVLAVKRHLVRAAGPDCVTFIDADCMLTRRLDEVYARHAADMIVTRMATRYGNPTPQPPQQVNSGVVFMRKPGALAFVDDWHAAQDDPEHWARQKPGRTALDQQSLGPLCESAFDGERKWTCAIESEYLYNCERNLGQDEQWLDMIRRYRPAVIHYKGGRWQDDALHARVMEAVHGPPPRPSVLVSMATMPHRFAMLEALAPVVSRNCDRYVLHVNGALELPASVVALPNVEARYYQQNMGSIVRFDVDPSEYDYTMILDDDMHYTDAFFRDSLAAARRNPGCAISWHGTYWREDLIQQKRCVYDGADHDFEVMEAGAGVLIVPPSALPPLEAVQNHNNDVTASLWLVKQGIRIITPRRAVNSLRIMDAALEHTSQDAGAQTACKMRRWRKSEKFRIRREHEELYAPIRARIEAAAKATGWPAADARVTPAPEPGRKPGVRITRRRGDRLPAV